MTTFRGATVIGRDGRNIGPRCVIYCRERRVYLHQSGQGTTPSRFWAWSGTRAQAANCIREFGVPGEFRVYLDGKEREYT